jgi:hypothetical protein
MVCYSLIQSPFLELVYGLNLKSNDFSKAGFWNVFSFFLMEMMDEVKRGDCVIVF